MYDKFYINEIMNNIKVLLTSKVDKCLTINNKNLKTNIYLNKSDIGLCYVDNTADINKPISKLMQQELDNKVDKTITINGKQLVSNIVLSKCDIHNLDKIDNTSDLDKPVSVIQQKLFNKKVDKSIRINKHLLNKDIFLTKKDFGLDNVDNTSDLEKPISNAVQSVFETLMTTLDNNTIILENIISNCSSFIRNTLMINNKLLNTNIVLTKSDIGLDQVDNVSDMNKPVSSLHQVELNLKEDKLNKNIPNGYVGLDNNGLIDVSRLPTLGLRFVDYWNAQTNSPLIISSQGRSGDYYKVNVAGTTQIDNISNWNIDDWIIFNGQVWDKITNNLGLDQVNNTSDMNKPISTIQQASFNYIKNNYILNVLSTNTNLITVNKVNNNLTLTPLYPSITNFNETFNEYQSTVTNGPLLNFGSITGWLNNNINLKDILIPNYNNDSSSFGIIVNFMPITLKLKCIICWEGIPNLNNTIYNDSIIKLNNIDVDLISVQQQTVATYAEHYITLNLVSNTINIISCIVISNANNSVNNFKIGLYIN